jgi:tryptophan synthase alpha chain
MTNRIDQRFKDLGETCAFVAYICAGDPNMEKSLEIIKGLADVGADIIELGIPFSDPLADGVVNQLAADRALKAGADLHKVLQLVKDFRKTHQTPLVLFSYLNPIYTYGFEAFHKDFAEAGADGVLLLDLPPDEAKLNSELCAQSGLKRIVLIAPTSPEERIAALAKQSEGFIYALSRTGVTGAQAAPSASIGATVRKIKAHTNTPVCVGFGINSAEQAAVVASVSDGVVVGSAIVNVVAQNGDKEDVAKRVANFTRPLIEAVKNL